MTKYICIEGGEGTYKTTTTAALVAKLESTGAKVLSTKEPGTSHIPLTMTLRELMLSNQYDQILTAPARELISQTIRSIHLERLIIPAIESGYYDYIIQDRGIMSGAIYAACCGNNKRYVDNLTSFVTSPIIRLRPYVYDSVFVFHNQDGLNTALNAKDEFAGLGDAMESRGVEFHEQVNKRFRDACAFPDHWSFVAKQMHSIDVHGKTTEDIVNRVVYMI